MPRLRVSIRGFSFTGAGMTRLHGGVCAMGGRAGCLTIAAMEFVPGSYCRYHRELVTYIWAHSGKLACKFEFIWVVGVADSGLDSGLIKIVYK